MLRAGSDDLDQVGAALSWRVWLLVPLALVSLLGLAVPAVERRNAPALIQDPLNSIPKEGEARVPYNGELKALYLDGDGIAQSDRLLIARTHQRLASEAEANDGTIAQSHWAEVERLLKRYR